MYLISSISTPPTMFLKRRCDVIVPSHQIILSPRAQAPHETTPHTIHMLQENLVDPVEPWKVSLPDLNSTRCISKGSEEVWSRATGLQTVGSRLTYQWCNQTLGSYAEATTQFLSWLAAVFCCKIRNTTGKHEPHNSHLQGFRFSGPGRLGSGVRLKSFALRP